MIDGPELPQARVHSPPDSIRFLPVAGSSRPFYRVPAGRGHFQIPYFFRGIWVIAGKNLRVHAVI